MILNQTRQFIKHCFSSWKTLIQKMQIDLVNNYKNHHMISSSLQKQLLTVKYPLQSQMFESLNLFCKYPTRKFDQQCLKKFQATIYKLIHTFTNEELNTLFAFYLQFDKNCDQSVVYFQFVKFYIGGFKQLLKAKYMVNIQEETFASSIKKILSKFITHSFLSRVPPYQRNLLVLFPHAVINLSLSNKMQSSTLFKKVVSQQFYNICKFYQNQMGSNLYNPKNITLYKMLARNVKLFCSQRLVQKNFITLQLLYLRQLFIKLFLIVNDINSVIFLYHYIKNKKDLQQTQLKQQFLSCVENSIIDKQKLKELPVEQLLLITVYSDSELRQYIWSLIIVKISPIIVQNHLIELIKSSLFTSMTYFNKLAQVICSSEQFFSRLKISQLKALTFYVNENRSKMGQLIVKSLMNRNYKNLTLKQVLDILSIYTSLINVIRNLPETAQIRVFLFRYLSDHHQLYTIFELNQMVQNLIQLNDWQLFNDNDNNYPNDIFVEVKQSLTKVSDSINCKMHLKNSIYSIIQNIKY